MTYMLRDRPDGQVEIVLSRPVLVGIFPERDVALRVCAFLQDEAIDWPEDQPAGFATAASDAAEAEAEDLDDLAEVVAPAPRRRPLVRNLPAVVSERPLPPPFLTPAPTNLTEDQKDAAFRRLSAGEKLATVAPEFGLSMGQLRGMWANQKRHLQKHLAEGGQQPCANCQRPFLPSISNPHTCARCSRD